jgi:hypothetical protein
MKNDGRIIDSITSRRTSGSGLLSRTETYGAGYYSTAPGSGAVSDNLGNTWTQVASQAGGAGLWVAKVTTGGAITVIFNPGGTQCALAVAEYSGVVSVSPVDTSASATSATSASSTTTPASGNMTTANAADLIFGGANQSSAAVTWSPGTGFVVRAFVGSVGTVNAAVESVNDQKLNAARDLSEDAAYRDQLARLKGYQAAATAKHVQIYDCFYADAHKKQACGSDADGTTDA